MKLTFDASEIRSKLVEPLQGGAQRVAMAVAVALTKTAVAVRDAERAEMRDVFDRPTPYTLNALYLKSATPASLEARVGFKDEGSQRGALAWLQWHIKGGQRTQTAYEKLLTRAGAMRSDQRAVPGQFARLDAFGNISRGQLVQILSQLRIDTTAGSTRSLPRVDKTDNAKTARYKAGVIRRAYTRAGGQYMALPNGRGRLKPGIYLVRQFASGRADPRPVLIFVTRTQYEAERFDWSYVAQTTIQRVLPQQLAGQMARSLLRANATPGQRVSIE